MRRCILGGHIIRGEHFETDDHKNVHISEKVVLVRLSAVRWLKWKCLCFVHKDYSEEHIRICHIKEKKHG